MSRLSQNGNRTSMPLSYYHKGLIVAAVAIFYTEVPIFVSSQWMDSAETLVDCILFVSIAFAGRPEDRLECAQVAGHDLVPWLCRAHVALVFSGRRSLTRLGKRCDIVF